MTLCRQGRIEVGVGVFTAPSGQRLSTSKGVAEAMLTAGRRGQLHSLIQNYGRCLAGGSRDRSRHETSRA